MSGSLTERDDFYPVLGHLVGKVTGDKVPVKILGSPHFSLDEFRQLADAAGLIEPLTRFVGRLTVDTCASWQRRCSRRAFAR